MRGTRGGGCGAGAPGTHSCGRVVPGTVPQAESGLRGAAASEGRDRRGWAWRREGPPRRCRLLREGRQDKERGSGPGAAPEPELYLGAPGWSEGGSGQGCGGRRLPTAPSTATAREGRCERAPRLRVSGSEDPRDGQSGWGADGAGSGADPWRPGRGRVRARSRALGPGSRPGLRGGAHLRGRGRPRPGRQGVNGRAGPGPGDPAM